MWYRSIGHLQLYKKGNVSTNSFEKEWCLVVKGLKWVLRFLMSWILILHKPLDSWWSCLQVFSCLTLFLKNGKSDLQQYINGLYTWSIMWSFNKQWKSGRLMRKIEKNILVASKCNYFKYSVRLIILILYFLSSAGFYAYRLYFHLIWAHLAATSHSSIWCWVKLGQWLVLVLVTCLLLQEQDTFLFHMLLLSGAF